MLGGRKNAWLARFLQTGPAWLIKDRSAWSISRDFTRNIPQDERRVQVFTVVRNGANKLNRWKGVVNYSHNLEKVQGIIVCLLQMMVSDQVVKAKLSSPELRHAEISKEILELVN